VEVGARLGYVGSGIMHLAIAFIAIQVAWAGSGTAADQSGALQSLAGTPLGKPFGPYLLTLVAVGLAAYGVYTMVRARYTRL
jgi:hypothetical protein